MSRIDELEARLRLVETRTDSLTKIIDDLRATVDKIVCRLWKVVSLLAIFGDAAQGVADFKE